MSIKTQVFIVRYVPNYNYMNDSLQICRWIQGSKLEFKRFKKFVFLYFETCIIKCSSNQMN